MPIKRCEEVDEHILCGRKIIARNLCLKHYKRARRRGFSPKPKLDLSGWTRENLSWLAGLIEGEGYIAIDKPKTGNRYHIRIRIQMTDLDVLEKAHKISGMGIIWGPRQPRPKHTKLVWEWSVGNEKHSMALLYAIYPWLCSRRKERAKYAIKCFIENGI